MKKVVFLVFLLASSVYSQDKFDQVHNAEYIVYFGLDFKDFKLTNPEKIGTEPEVAKYILPWINKYEKNNHLKMWKLWLHKDIYIHSDSVQKRYLDMPDEWIFFDEKEINNQYSKNAIKQYPSKYKKGVGLVIIVEWFNKRRNTATTRNVFFDIKTREVLWETTTSGFSKRGVGMVRRWGFALKGAFHEFKNNYKVKRRKHK